MNKEIYKYIAFSVILVILAISFVFLFYSVPALKKSYRMNLKESTQSALVTAIPQFEKALKKGDDIALYIQIENLAKSKDISKVYILDKSGRILIHNDSKEWGKNCVSPEHLKGINSKNSFLQSYNQGYLYSAPIDKDKFLFLAISPGRLNSYLKSEYKKMFFYSAICTFSGLIMSFIFFLRYLANPIDRLKKYLHSSSMDDKLDYDGKYEFMGILKLVCSHFKRK